MPAWLLEFLTSSIGKKVQVALTGLLLCGFLVTHLAGNLLMFRGPEAFNHYSEALRANPLLPLAEILLAWLFLVHALVAVWLTYQNRRARPVRYERSAWVGGRTIGSATMIYSGLLLLAFLVVHVKTFRIDFPGGSLYDWVLTRFANPYYSLFYVVAMAALALHLSHGFQSGLQTFGVNHPRYTPWIKAFGLVFAVAVTGGFAFVVGACALGLANP